MQIYPFFKIDHCNRRVDCRIFRILITHDIQATKSMFGLSQSNLCCVVVFIPRLCMMAELLVPAPSPLCVVCPLRTAEVRGPLPVSRSRSATSCVTVSTSQLSSIPTSNNGREKISADHNSNLSKLTRLVKEVRGNCNIFPLLARCPYPTCSVVNDETC